MRFGGKREGEEGREGGRERGEAQKTHPSFSRASFLLSSPLLFTMLFHLVLFAHLSSSYSPTRAKLASEVRVTQPPRVVEKTTIHPFFAPRKANDLLFSWLGPISPLRGRIIHARVTLHARVYTPLYSFAKRFFLFSFFFSSSSPREIKTNGNRMANMIR